MQPFVLSVLLQELGSQEYELLQGLLFTCPAGFLDRLELGTKRNLVIAPKLECPPITMGSLFL